MGAQMRASLRADYQDCISSDAIEEILKQALIVLKTFAGLLRIAP